jgi:hypothetical protein
MFKKMMVHASLLGVLAGCGGMEQGEMSEAQPVPVDEATPLARQSARETATLLPGETRGFPSWYGLETKVSITGYGATFERTDVHVWCTTGKPEHDQWFTVEQNQYYNFHWSCWGRRIWVHNLGTQTHQLLHVVTE